MINTKVGMTASPSKDKGEFSPADIEQRREAALKKMLTTPPTPHAAEAKKKPSPGKSKAKKSR